MARESSQKFIARNRAPRVQIEYDVEIYGTEKKVQLPFVNGVLADLSGDAAESLPKLGERKMLEFSAENFDERMKSIKPRLEIAVENKLTGEGKMNLELSFEELDDFTPGAVAEQVEPLRKLLQARNQLSNLITYMDGKAGAEELIAQVINNPELLQSLLSAAKPAEADAATETEKEEA